MRKCIRLGLPLVTYHTVIALPNTRGPARRSLWNTRTIEYRYLMRNSLRNVLEEVLLNCDFVTCGIVLVLMLKELKLSQLLKTVPRGEPYLGRYGLYRGRARRYSMPQRRSSVMSKMTPSVNQTSNLVHTILLGHKGLTTHVVAG